MNPPQIGRRIPPVAEDRKEDNSSSAFRVQAFICVICHRLGSGCVFYLKIMGLCVGKKLSGLAARAYRRTRRCGGVRIIFTFPPLIFFHLDKMLVFQACAGGIVRGVRGHV